MGGDGAPGSVGGGAGGNGRQEPLAAAERRRATPVVKALAGSVGGMTEALFLQPMDVVKTRLQLDRAGRYAGVRDCLATTAREEGTRALWKGLTPFATHLSLKYMLRMGTNAVYQNALRDERGELSSRARLAAGFGAGVTEALVIVTPFEVVKIKLQQQRGTDAAALRYKGPLHCAAAVVREQGVLGLWAGAAPTVLRNGTNQMCMFWAKNGVDGLLWDKRDGDGRTLHPLQSMASGAVAATLGPFATGPFDVVKTRLMAQERAQGTAPKYRGLLHALTLIPREEGVRVLWKGLVPRLLRIPPGQAITWAAADQLVGLYERGGH
jgi:solute carrier family 25 citrate transporter 1